MESPPTQMSKCSGSTTQFRSVGLQNCNSSLARVKCSVFFGAGVERDAFESFELAHGADGAACALVNVELHDGVACAGCRCLTRRR